MTESGQTSSGQDRRGQRKERIGKVTSDKMNKTVVVEIQRVFSHPLYKKYITLGKSFYAHDEENRCKVGDTVRIIETRPMSKTKRWRVAAILERAK
ncbi:30S ribosomal protein S17 [Candidatus Sumerlaeota bacterium]|nr:30S ribosomal protein S17 [Candidatus Sumerlaeota bacterium]